MKLNIILGNQLFPYKYYSKSEGDFFMCEDWDLCTHFKPHKAKIYFFLCSMREYRDNFPGVLHYYELNPKPQFFLRLKEVVEHKKVNCLTLYEVEDKFFEQKIKNFAKEEELEINFLSSPNFICSREDFHNYVKGTKKPFMKTFYENQRREHNILMEGESPRGGKYSFDSENRKKIPKKFEVTAYELPENNSPYKNEIKKLIKKFFSDHPGEDVCYGFPTNRENALKHLKHFIENRLQYFGDYEDAIDDRNPFLYHSLLSPLINIGFLNPREVLEKVEAATTMQNINSAEGLIRQLLGWREFMRGIYQNYSEEQDSGNFFKHKKKLKDCWYQGETGIPILDKTIEKVQKYGYCHHIERLMVLSNLMLLLEVDPKEVHRWFMEMFVDSLDWVMGPNIYGMGQFSDGGIFATKPYISGSNYIRKMSHEKKGDWCDAWDGLYWQFITRNREFFEKNYRMKMMVSMLDKMDSEKKQKLFKAADAIKSELVYL